MEEEAVEAGGGGGGCTAGLKPPLEGGLFPRPQMEKSKSSGRWSNPCFSR